MSPIRAAVPTVTFIGEHFVGKDGGHTALSKSNLLVWALLSIVNGIASVYFGPALLSCILAHLLINAPASIRPFLRGRAMSSRR